MILLFTLSTYLFLENRRLKKELKASKEDGLTDVLVFTRKYRDNGDIKEVKKALAPMVGYKVMKKIDPQWDYEHYSWGVKFSYREQR